MSGERTMADPTEFIGVYCPNDCVEYNSYSPNQKYMMVVVWGRRPGKSAEPMTVQCPKCHFEAWISKSVRDELGKPDQPYLEDRKVVIPEKVKRK